MKKFVFAGLIFLSTSVLAAPISYDPTKHLRKPFNVSNCDLLFTLEHDINNVSVEFERLRKLALNQVTYPVVVNIVKNMTGVSLRRHVWANGKRGFKLDQIHHNGKLTTTKYYLKDGMFKNGIDSKLWLYSVIDKFIIPKDLTKQTLHYVYSPDKTCKMVGYSHAKWFSNPVYLWMKDFLSF